MEPAQLLTLGLAMAVFLAAFRRCTTRPHDRTIRVCEPAIARRAIIDHADAFSNRPLPRFPAGRPVTHSISSAPYGPLWRTLRCNLTADILRRSRLGILSSLEREAAEALAASLSSRGGTDVVLRNTLHSAVFALQDFFVSFSVVKASERSWLTWLLHWRQRRHHAGIFDRINKVFMPAVVARRRWSQQGKCGGFWSYVDSLLELRVPKDDEERARRLLTDEEMAFLVWEFLGAGISGTVTCLEWTLAHLAVEPEVQKKLHREVVGDQCKGTASELRLPYLHAVVLESMRLHPPLPFLSREVHAEGITLGKAAVPPGGAPVSFVLGAIGRDRKVWRNPDEFRPDRFLEGGEAKG